MCLFVQKRRICFPAVLGFGIVITMLGSYLGSPGWIFESSEKISIRYPDREGEYTYSTKGTGRNGTSAGNVGAIMLGIPLFNQQGYVKFTSSIIKSNHPSRLSDIHLFDDSSTTYTDKDLQNWYSGGVHINSNPKHFGLVGTILHILEHFTKSNYEILFIAGSDLVFSSQMFEFVSKNLNRTDVIMSYRSDIECVAEKKGCCISKVAHAIGSAMKKSYAKSILKYPNRLRLIGNMDVIIQDPYIHVLSPVESLAMRVGQYIDSEACTSYAEARNFDRCAFPKWIQEGIQFYHDKCNDGNVFHDEHSSNDNGNIFYSKPVVSYSLYGGSNPRYIDGAFANSELMLHIYPEWRMWVYHDNSISESVLRTLCRRDIRLINMTGTKVNNPMSWRFFVASDLVKRYIVRDIDSRLSMRERAAVDEWIKSGKKFHIMRDHPAHSNFAMSGGMWGGTHEAIPQMRALLESRSMTGAYLQDMNFLNDVIWPIAKLSVMQHDAFPNGRYGQVYPFPTPRIGYKHVGSVYINGEMRQGDVDILKRRLLNG